MGGAGGEGPGPALQRGRPDDGDHDVGVGDQRDDAQRDDMTDQRDDAQRGDVVDQRDDAKAQDDAEGSTIQGGMSQKWLRTREPQKKRRLMRAVGTMMAEKPQSQEPRARWPENLGVMKLP